MDNLTAYLLICGVWLLFAWGMFGALKLIQYRNNKKK